MVDGPLIADPEQALRCLARALAPHLLEEVQALLGTGPQTPPLLGPAYDDATARVFVTGLGPNVIDRALELFSALREPPHSIDSVHLAERLGADSPRQIPGLLTTPLKRRASALGLPRPWEERRLRDVTVWSDRDDLSERLYGALEQASAGNRAIDLELAEAGSMDPHPVPSAVSVYAPEYTQWTSSGASDGESCLRDARLGSRVAIYRAHQDQGIVALFDVGEHPWWDEEFRWMAAGHIHVLDAPISRDELLADDVLRSAFETIQGRRRLPPAAQRALAKMLEGQFPDHRLPEFVPLERPRRKTRNRRRHA